MQTQSSPPLVQSISPSEAHKLQGQGCVLLDVRSPAEYRALHAHGASNCEIHQVKQPWILTEFVGGDQPVVFTCHSGKRAKDAADLAASYHQGPIYVVEGGTVAWEEAGLPIEKGKGTISLERQVRIAAGCLVAVGTLLGMTLSPWYLVLPLFVGCGLVFAGISDTCGMSLLLARMPWNR